MSEQCPHCGCQVYDPFGWGRIVHDINKCFAAIKPAVGVVSVTGMREGNRPLSEEGGSLLLQSKKCSPTMKSTTPITVSSPTKVYDYVDKLIENVNTESDQCLNDGAEDIAMLLGEASKALKQMADTLWDIAVWKPHHDSKTRGETYYEIRAKHCLKNLGK